MIDTDNLVSNEKDVTNKACAVTTSDDVHINAQASSDNVTHQSSNMFTRLFRRFTKEKQPVQLNTPENVKVITQKPELSQDQKMVNAILDSAINVVYDKHVIKVKVLDSEMLPKEFVGFIGKHADLLLKLRLQNIYNFYFGFLYEQTLVKTIHQVEKWHNDKNAHEIIIIKMIANYFDYFLKLLFENDHLLQLLQQKQFLYNLLIIYNNKMNLKDPINEDWTLVMQKFTPIMLTECYRIYDKFDIKTCTIIDLLALTIQFKQVSLFSSVCINNRYAITDEQIKKFIDKQSVMMYDERYINDLLNAGNSIYFNQIYCKYHSGVHKCCSQDDIIRTIDCLKAYSSMRQQNNIELDIDNIRLNGYRQFIEDYQKVDDPVIQKICKKLLTAQD